MIFSILIFNYFLRRKAARKSTTNYYAHPGLAQKKTNIFLPDYFWDL